MGAEEQAPQNGIAKVTTETPAPVVATGESQPAPPPEPVPEEEPPKIEEIVTPEVLQEIVKGYNPDSTLVSWSAKIGSEVGDNYMSILYAVDLELQDKTKNEAVKTVKVMLKTLPRNVFRAEMITEMSAFAKETEIYQTVLPVFQKIQEEREIPKEEIFRAWPICYAAHLDGKSDYLAMEDLKVSGYTMGNRKKGLDFNHSAAVLSNLARYHAISYAKYGGSREKILQDFPLLGDSMFSKEIKATDMQQQFFTQSFKMFAEGLKGKGADGDLASARLEKLAEVQVRHVLGDLTTKNIDCAVIIHGDCWVNNIMFRYGDLDTAKKLPIGVNFIDFQLAVATSRMVDVSYFLLTSCIWEMLNEREEDLLMIYYAEFTRFAERLGVNTKEKGLTWENLKEEADKYRLYGVYLGLLLAPMFSADSADIPDMETMKEEEFENMEEATKQFLKDLNKESVMTKVKNIVLKHLPRCKNVEEFL